MMSDRTVNPSHSIPWHIYNVNTPNITLVFIDVSHQRTNMAQGRF